MYSWSWSWWRAMCSKVGMKEL